MKLRAALAGCAATLLITSTAYAQQHNTARVRQLPTREHFAPETESETNSMTFLLTHGYQVVAGWDGALVLQKAARVYICPFIRVREGNTEFGRAVSQPCQHVHEGMYP